MSTVSDELALFRPIVRERLNTELNPRPLSEPDNNALALMARIRRLGQVAHQRGGSVRAISLQPWSNVNVRAWPTGF